MGKLLEILRKGDAGPAPVLPLPVRPATVETVVPIRAEVESEEPEEEYLFIEVGAAGKKLDGSPAVLATPVARPAITAATEKKAAPVTAPVMRPTRPMTVAFEPWPAGGQAASYVAPEIITYHQPDHPASKQYAELFQKVTEGLGKSPVLVFSGAAAKAGTTTVLLNLAFSGCRHKRRIALVEANLSRPALAERLGLQTAPGWHEFLAGQVGLEKALQTTAQPQLFALVAGAGSQGVTVPPEAYRWVLSWLRDRFDLVLIDAPEMSDHSSLTSLIPAGEGIYLVLPQNGSESSQLGDMAQGIIRMGGRLRGLIHTQFESL